MADPIWQSIISIFQLNGPAMSHFLPMEAFKWVENIQQRMQKNPDFWRVNAENSEVGYILEVDIDYLSQIRNDHKVLPFCQSTEMVWKGEVCGALLYASTRPQSWFGAAKNFQSIGIQAKSLVPPLHRDEYQDARAI